MKTETLCPFCFANHYALVDVNGDYFICQECKGEMPFNKCLEVELRTDIELDDYSTVEFFNYDQHWLDGKRPNEAVVTRELVRDMRFIHHLRDIIQIGKITTQLIAVTPAQTLIVKRIKG